MNWLIFVAITLLADSFRIFLDNYTSDVYFKGRGAMSQKLFHGALQILVALIALPFCGIDFAHTDFLTLLPFFLSGFLISFAGLPYFRALELDDSTNLGIFIQLTPILYLVFNWIFFGETIAPTQLLAFVVIMAAPMLILRFTQKRSRKVKMRAILFAFLNVLIIVISNIIFVRENNAELGLLTEMTMFYFGKGLCSMITISAVPKWRRRFVAVMRQNPRKLPKLLTLNTGMGILADVTYRLALILAPSMALASAASDAVEPIVIFFMGIILTLIRPKFGREKLGRKSILVHLGATVLVVAGVALIQI